MVINLILRFIFCMYTLFSIFTTIQEVPRSLSLTRSEFPTSEPEVMTVET